MIHKFSRKKSFIAKNRKDEKITLVIEKNVKELL